MTERLARVAHEAYTKLNPNMLVAYDDLPEALKREYVIIAEAVGAAAIHDHVHAQPPPAHGFRPLGSRPVDYGPPEDADARRVS